MSEDQTRVLSDAPAATGAQAPEGRIGAYRLVRMLGQGGMGEVWLAERADAAFSKQVAIKFMGSFQNREAVDWFRRERQALARLEHPNIARLLDGGETPDGRLFLVMEYVDGVPIDQWCEGKPLDAVIDLFVQVCSAIEHAHRALIVHRDIKPANVLVTAAGESRLLDFGIAKEMEEGGSGSGEQTTTQAYTLHYASPEQLEGGTITVASDIYSLGALLYRLLSGRVPHASAQSALGQLQAIQTTQPQRPSRVVLEQRGLADAERRRRARRLHGDLDDIVLKCLRKEPELRYGSARELIEDIGRYRAHEPVLARKGSASYRASRFLRRNWLGLAAAAAVLLTLAGGLAATWAQKQEAERQRALAQKRFDLSRALVNDVLFDFQDRLADVPGTIQARRALVDRTKAYINTIAADAQDDPGLLVDLALVERRLGDLSGNPSQSNLGDTAAAGEHYRKALALSRRAVQLRPGDREATLAFIQALHSQGDFHFWNDDLVRAGQRYAEELPLVRAFAKSAPGEESRRLLFAAEMGVADVHYWSSKLELALAAYNRACAPVWRLPGGDFRSRDAIATCHTRHADTLAWLERYPEAEAHIAHAVAIYRPFYEREPDSLRQAHAFGIALSKQGEILAWSGKHAQSLAAYSRLVAVADKAHRADPTDLRAARNAALAFNKRGDALTEAKRFREAIDDYLKARGIIEALVRTDAGQREYERDFGLSSHRIGLAYVDSGNAAAALPYFEHGLQLMRRRFGEEPGKAWSVRDLAVAIQDRTEAPATPAQLCAWRREFRELMLSLKAMGSATPSDLAAIAEVEPAIAACGPAPVG